MATNRYWTMTLVVMVAFLMGCGESDQTVQQPSRLLMIGIDSADWGLLDRMIEDQRLPNLAALRAQSASGTMRSFHPLEKSPLLWASICTGMKPEVHGIGHFVKGAEQSPLGANDWEAPAIWDIIGPVGRKSAVIGMWMTYPARDISGVLVSDYLQYSSTQKQTTERMISPDSLSAPLSSLRVTMDDIEDADLAHFLPVDKIPIVERKKPRLLPKLKAFFAADLTYLSVARELAKEDAFDFFFLYLRGPDMVSHKFWRFYEPEKGNLPRDPELEEILGQVVPRYYEWTDEAVGEVLSWFPEDRQVVTVSDHGFYGPRVVETSFRDATQEHTVNGIFTIRSPLYEPGTRFNQLELLSVCPTLLSLLGIPPAEDMPGGVLLKGLSDEGRQRLPDLERNRIESYQMLAPGDIEGGETPEIDEKIREQLRTLGYI
ncbi:alkaline phosphatase family protein [Candidatus Eisenbacteria bacterium]|uniref:Alkaline phosphatase family protein n=1 Tax=Eiseniibacteriota bacterium TaxID=2212470 RepID=A0ABV6YIW0_UNCEI